MASYLNLYFMLCAARRAGRTFCHFTYCMPSLTRSSITEGFSIFIKRTFQKISTVMHNDILVNDMAVPYYNETVKFL